MSAFQQTVARNRRRETNDARDSRTNRADGADRTVRTPRAWLIATCGDLREVEARVNIRIDDTKSEINARIDDTKSEINTRIDDTKSEINARIDELKADGRARDAKLDALTEMLVKMQAGLEADRRNNRTAIAWLGVAVAALGIIAGVASRFI